MFQRLAMLILAGAMSFAPSAALRPALADEWPSLLGEWRGTAEVIALGEAPNHFDTSDDLDAPQYLEKTITVFVERQRGRRFWGRLEADDSREPLIGMVKADKLSALVADTDGYYDWRLYGPENIEVCYAHALEEDESVVVHCADLVKIR